MNSLRILFIEDDADDLMILEQVLNSQSVSFETKAIRYGDHALEYLEKCVVLPDVIVLDLNLPNMNGRDLLSRIKSTTHLREIPVVVLTTSSSKEDEDFCKQMGSRKFFTKPSTTEGFNAIMKEIIGIGLENSG